MITLPEQKYILLSSLVFGYSEWAKKQTKGHEVEPNDDPGTYFATDEAQKILEKLSGQSPEGQDELWEELTDMISEFSLSDESMEDFREKLKQSFTLKRNP